MAHVTAREPLGRAAPGRAGKYLVVLFATTLLVEVGLAGRSQ
jgi:hypothetical protein